MEFRVLGQLAVVRNGVAVDLGAYRQRALLGVLLTRPNGVISADQLIDAIWGDDAATDRQNALWVYISGLRGALDPDREKRTEGSVLLTRSPGYLIAVEPEDIDAVRFERMVQEGRSLLDTDPAAASLVLGEALALWRGRPYEDFTYESFFQTEIARLEEIRVEAVEARIDADLKRGMARELVSELESLVREHPLRERFTGQLMLALYRSGRQAEALRAYQGLQSRLGDELGIEPSAAIRTLEEQMVTGDSALESEVALAGGDQAPGLAVRGYELREKIGEGAFGVAYKAYQPAVGREVAVKVIRPELADDPAFIRRFEAEARLVATLEHPHIVPLYDYWREPGAAYLVMRLMRGGSLEEVLETSALDGAQATRVANQIAGALKTAHDHGVVHRDIKPSNILIDDEGNAYLSDFGIAVGAGGGPPAQAETTLSLAPPYASPEQLDNGEVSPSSDIYSLGVALAQAITGLRGEIDQIRGALGPEVAGVIDRATQRASSDRYQDAPTFARELGRSLGADPSEPAPLFDLPNPYKGLRAFEEGDAADFFGRERLVDRLLYRLGEPGKRSRFTALIGPSGSGKSSVIKAGLMPALAAGALPGSADWFVLEMVPAPYPFEELESALRSVAVDPPTSLLEELSKDSDGLRRMVARVLPDDGSQLLLVIDQFEELFTQVDEDIAERFIACVVDAATAEHSRVRVLVTMRADFYDRPLGQRRLGELLREGTEVITPMSPEELERAITGPAERMGASLEPALVAQIIRDVVDRPSALPLMQYTLTELFDTRTTARITSSAYLELDGVSGALVTRAEGLMSGLSESARDAARQVFLRLVTLGEGTDDTRRRTLESEIEDLSVARKDIRTVLETFGRHRMLSFDRDPVTRGPTVEIAHEALLKEWTRLRGWIDGARHDVRNQRRLAAAMEEWKAAGSTNEYLLRGGRLDQLRGWASLTTVPLSGPEREFLEASVAELQRQTAEEQEREERTAAAEERARHRSRQLVGAGVIGMIVAALAVFGIWQWRSATAANAEVEALLSVVEFVAASDSARNDDPELALLLAVEAVRQTADQGFATEGAVDAVHWAIQELGVQYEVDDTTPVAVRSGPNGPTGVYVIPPADLIAFAESSVDRSLTTEECFRYVGGPCPPQRDLPLDLTLRNGEQAYGARTGPMSLEGTKVTFLTSISTEPALEAQLEAFLQATGIEAEYQSDNTESRLARVRAEDLDPPDVAAWPQPSSLAEWAGLGALQDLSAYLDSSTLRSDFGEYLLSLGTVGTDGAWPASAGTLYGIPMDVDLKGIVYYPKPAFEAAGYEIPATMDDLLQLTEQIAKDGRASWCFGFFSGEASGWPGTDVIESLVLRFGGPAAYDDWTFGRIPFDSPAILEAAEYADSIVFGPGFVRSGPESISQTFFLDMLLFMFQRDRVSGELAPQCWLHHQADFMIGSVPDGTDLGVELGLFLMPPLEAGGATPATGGGNFVGAFRDRPEVRAFVEYIADPQWGEVWAAGAPGNFLSPNSRFDVSKYGVGDNEQTRETRIAIGSEVQAALEAGVFRFDASDLMPPAIGGFNGEEAGAFWAGMLDWVDGIRPIEQVFADIETAWQELKAAES